MRKLLGAGALVALILLVPVATSSAGAKAKPTTTTAPTTTTTTPAAPTLGVPHVVSSAPLSPRTGRSSPTEYLPGMSGMRAPVCKHRPM